MEPRPIHDPTPPNTNIFGQEQTFLGPVWNPRGNGRTSSPVEDFFSKPHSGAQFGLPALMENIRRGLGGLYEGNEQRKRDRDANVETFLDNTGNWFGGREQQPYMGAGGGAGGGAPSGNNADAPENAGDNNAGQDYEAYRDALNTFMRSSQMQGGTAGYDNRGAVSAYYDEMRGRVEGEYNNARGDIGNVYDQAADMMKPMAGQSAAAYTDAINAGAAQSESLIADTQERINADAASRASSFAELGISGDGRLSETSREAERGVSDIGANSSNWGGLMGALSVGQQSRLNQDYVGAGDAKVMAQTDLTSTYQDYLRAISEQESSQMADAYQPGTPGEMGPEFWETLPKSVQEEYWNRELGYKEQERPYSPEFAELEEYMLRTKGATIEEMNFMYDWRANSPANRDPMAMLNPLWNGQVNEYLDRK